MKKVYAILVLLLFAFACDSDVSPLEEYIVYSQRRIVVGEHGEVWAHYVAQDEYNKEHIFMYLEGLEWQPGVEYVVRGRLDREQYGNHYFTTLRVKQLIKQRAPEHFISDSDMVYNEEWEQGINVDDLYEMGFWQQP